MDHLKALLVPIDADKLQFQNEVYLGDPQDVPRLLVMMLQNQFAAYHRYPRWIKPNRTRPLTNQALATKIGLISAQTQTFALYQLSATLLSANRLPLVILKSHPELKGRHLEQQNAGNLVILDPVGLETLVQHATETKRQLQKSTINSRPVDASSDDPVVYHHGGPIEAMFRITIADADDATKVVLLDMQQQFRRTNKLSIQQERDLRSLFVQSDDQTTLENIPTHDHGSFSDSSSPIIPRLKLTQLQPQANKIDEMEQSPRKTTATLSWAPLASAQLSIISEFIDITTLPNKIMAQLIHQMRTKTIIEPSDLIAPRVTAKQVLETNPDFFERFMPHDVVLTVTTTNLGKHHSLQTTKGRILSDAQLENAKKLWDENNPTVSNLILQSFNDTLFWNENGDPKFIPDGEEDDTTAPGVFDTKSVNSIEDIVDREEFIQMWGRIKNTVPLEKMSSNTNSKLITIRKNGNLTRGINRAIVGQHSNIGTEIHSVTSIIDVVRVPCSGMDDVANFLAQPPQPKYTLEDPAIVRQSIFNDLVETKISAASVQQVVVFHLPCPENWTVSATNLVWMGNKLKFYAIIHQNGKISRPNSVFETLSPPLFVIFVAI